jgi:hypothetical protein
VILNNVEFHVSAANVRGCGPLILTAHKKGPAQFLVAYHTILTGLSGRIARLFKTKGSGFGIRRVWRASRGGDMPSELRQKLATRLTILTGNTKAETGARGKIFIMCRLSVSLRQEE